MKKLCLLASTLLFGCSQFTTAPMYHDTATYGNEADAMAVLTIDVLDHAFLTDETISGKITFNIDKFPYRKTYKNCDTGSSEEDPITDCTSQLNVTKTKNSYHVTMSHAYLSSIESHPDGTLSPAVTHDQFDIKVSKSSFKDGMYKAFISAETNGDQVVSYFKVKMKEL